MTSAARWSIGVAVIALSATSLLAIVGSSVSRAERRSAGSPASSPAARASSRVPPATASREATAPDASRPRELALTRGPRQRAMEAALRPILVEPSLRAGVFGLDIGSGAFFDVSGDRPFSAASLIKVPVAAALFAAVDGGVVSLDESLELRASDVAGGSGSLQYFPLGSRFTVKRLGELMMRRSDNTATNMLIGRLGGRQALNFSFAGWGLAHTQLRQPLPDMAGANTTSPRDLVMVLERAVGDAWLRPASRDLLLSWMRRSHVRSLLPAGVGRGSRVANKTGDIPGALGDAGLIEVPGGRRYLLAVQVERPYNSPRAKALIRGVSRRVYEGLTGLRAPALVESRPTRSRPVRRASSLAARRASAS